ncbi:MAG TPA: hypothetical protein PL151_07040 [Phycisphaerae bacterium]|nr:hypothetical protein [Phycisphaerae bacterium]HOM50391.1 hypothetical protein [Phycisphaerae bacterium]HON67708.1 hypothetical protein [Phycisphaerae bacterium]HQE27496.1 hypothetical protein [Phycisphaerae bacterium]
MRYPRYLSILIAVGLLGSAVHAHEAHMQIGRSASGQLKCNPADGVQDDTLTVLNLIPPGGPISGYSASVPGFGLVISPSVADDCYPLDPGADVWLEIIAIDAPLLMVETPSYWIINERIPPELRIGGDINAHVHPLWLLDTTDPAFNPVQCTWEIYFILKDKGSTGYHPSELMRFRFSAGRVPCPADFDCDGDVDSDDLDLLHSCATGPAVRYDAVGLPAGCTLSADGFGVLPADLDKDWDIDQTDFAIFQRCYSGAGVPADPYCAD